MAVLAMVEPDSDEFHTLREQIIEGLLALTDDAGRAAAAGVVVVNGSPYQSGLLAGIDLDAAAANGSPDIERARRIYAWCAERDIEVGAVAVQFSMRDPRIGATLVGPRTVAEIEENVRHGGFGSAVLETLSDEGVTRVQVERIGVADTFIEHGPQQLLRSLYGIDAPAIVKAAERLMNAK